jgi:hypothetical protein
MMTLSQIEQAIDILSYDELMCLLERLVQSLRQKSAAQMHASSKNLEQQIAGMAANPDIQRELSEIDREFAVTESDGLEKL